MKVSDLDEVLKIEQGANELPWSRPEIENLLQGSGTTQARQECWVACLAESEQTGSIIAYALVSIVLDESSLLNLCVAVSEQGRGFGKAFLEYLLMQARKSRDAKYFLEVRCSNKKAIKLYESFGFQKDSVRTDYYPTSSGREDGFTYSLIF